MTNSVSGYKEDMEIYKHNLPSPQNNDFFCCAETYIDDESFSLALRFKVRTTCSRFRLGEQLQHKGSQC